MTLYVEILSRRDTHCDELLTTDEKIVVTKEEIERLQRNIKGIGQLKDDLTNKDELTTLLLTYQKQLDELSGELPALQKRKRILLSNIESCQEDLSNCFQYKQSDVVDVKLLRFCLVDLLKPTILEVAVPKGYCGKVLLKNLPYTLHPFNTDDVKSRGEYMLVRGNQYMFRFFNPLAANVASKKNLGWDELTLQHSDVKPVLDKSIVPPLLKCQFNAARLVLSLDGIEKIMYNDTLYSEVIGSAIEDESDRHAIAKKTLEAIMSCQDIANPPPEILNNKYVAKWVRNSFSDKCMIYTEESPPNVWCSRHYNSKPDLVVLPKSKGGDKAIVCQLPMGVGALEEAELIGVAGEFKNTDKADAQLLANMMVVAGQLAHQNVFIGRSFRTIEIYGVQCQYQEQTASLMVLMLDFKEIKSVLTKYRETGKIDEVIEYAVSQLLTL